MTGHRARRRALIAAATSATLAAGLLAGCAAERSADAPDHTPADATIEGPPIADDDQSDPPDPQSEPSGEAADDPRLRAMSEHAVDPPGDLRAELLPADMLVYSREPIDADMVASIEALEGVAAVEPMALAQIPVEDRVISVAAVDPASYRRFTPVESAQTVDVWNRVAGGELAVRAAVGERLADDDGYLRLGNEESSPQLHVGALAPQIPQVDAVVNRSWGESLGMGETNALLVSTGATAPQQVRRPLQRITGETASVQVLGPDLDVTVQQTAVLTGGSVADAVGSFNYRVLDGGRVAPDPAWVRANIRTQQVPILGSVTCHKAMLPQLEAALREVVDRGLADKIDPGEYAGCYYPRFIANSTQLSLHSFGIAFDINVPGNQRGTVGDLDRSVVQIFKKWGFAWGGDWSYTDPMHFEMAQIVRAQ